MKGLSLVEVNRWWALRRGREKAMLVACVIGGIAAGGDALWTAPLEKKVKKQVAATAGLQQRWQREDEARRAGAEQARTMREQEAVLRERVAQAQARVKLLNQRLADTARLPETLRAITATVGSAKLLELDLVSDLSGQAVPLGPAPTGASASGGEAANAGNGKAQANAGQPDMVVAAGRRMYRLPISLKVSGQWDELNLLLTQIERHAQALQWASVTLDSTDWPAIQLTLKAHVLSLQPRWGASS